LKVTFKYKFSIIIVNKNQHTCS